MTGGVPEEFIPEGYIGLTDYTPGDLDALAEEIAADTATPRDEIFHQLDALVNEYKVPIPEAERSVRANANDEEVST